MISIMVGSKKKIDKRKRKGQKDAEQKQRIRNYKKKQQENTRKKKPKKYQQMLLSMMLFEN